MYNFQKYTGSTFKKQKCDIIKTKPFIKNPSRYVFYNFDKILRKKFFVILDQSISLKKKLDIFSENSKKRFLPQKKKKVSQVKEIPTFRAFQEKLFLQQLLQETPPLKDVTVFCSKNIDGRPNWGSFFGIVLVRIYCYC